jgi:hypothetical protein
MDDELRYRPHLTIHSLTNGTTINGEGVDWVHDLELSTVQDIALKQDPPLKFLVLYGSLRER